MQTYYSATITNWNHYLIAVNQCSLLLALFFPDLANAVSLYWSAFLLKAVKFNYDYQSLKTIDEMMRTTMYLQQPSWMHNADQLNEGFNDLRFALLRKGKERARLEPARPLDASRQEASKQYCFSFANGNCGSANCSRLHQCFGCGAQGVSFSDHCNDENPSCKSATFPKGYRPSKRVQAFLSG